MISRGHSARLRLLLALSVAVAIVTALDRTPSLESLFQPLMELTATAAYIALSGVGLPVALNDNLLTHPDGFRVAISYGCTPVVPAIFLALVLIPGLRLAWRQRLIGLGSGIALITLLNLCRVTTLYYVGVVSPATFALAHEWLGQGVIVLGTTLVAVHWICVSARSRHKPVNGVLSDT